MAVLTIEGIDDQGEPIGVPAEWDEEAGEAPRLIVQPDALAGKSSAEKRHDIADWLVKEGAETLTAATQH